METVKPKEVNTVVRMALEMFEEFELDDEKIVFPDESKGIREAVKEVAPRVIEAAKRYKLPKKAVAAITLAVAMNRFLSFVLVEVECRCSLSKIAKVMRELGFERVRNKCMEEVILEGGLRARWNVAEEFFESLGRDFIILRVIPAYEELVFERVKDFE